MLIKENEACVGELQLNLNSDVSASNHKSIRRRINKAEISLGYGKCPTKAQSSCFCPIANCI